MFDPIKAAKVADHLNSASFRALLMGEINAIVLDEIVRPAERERATRVLRALTENTSYLWANDLRVHGVSVGEAHESAEKLDRYLAEAEHTMRIAREVVFDGVTAIDRITQKMLDVWGPGLRIPSIEGRPFLQQILRRWKQGGAANPHLDQSKTQLLSRFGMSKRIGVNAYIAMPTDGGAIEFWSREFSDAEYEACKRRDYGLDRELLGAADLTIRPRPGQVILFDASRPHAVEAVAGKGERVTNASFYAYAGDAAPLFTFA